MKSVFDKYRGANTQPNFFNIMKDFNKYRQNPSEIGDLLLKSGRIDKNQYEMIKTMNNPRQIGEYLLNNNAAFQKMYNGK